MTFEEKVSDWEKRVESVLVEIIKEKTVDGLHMCSDITPVVNSFNTLIDSVRNARTSRDIRISVPEYLKEQA